MSFNRLLGGVAASALAVVCVYEAEAQTTSSALRGVVSGVDGAPVAGAQLTIVHVPTGTASSAATSGNGVFFEGGLRVGGPFTVTVQADGFQAQVIDNVFLQPGPAEQFNVTLAPLTATETIIVTGERIETVSLNNGVGSAFTANDILNQPSSDRDLISTLLRDPLASSSGVGNLQVAGVNPRFNALAIDGSLQGNDFGLSSNTYATIRPPVSLDAVESISLVASDYSVFSSGFTGGLVNIVTKSGTNEIDGTFSYYRQDEDFIGNTAFGDFVDVAPFLEEEIGFTLGGPIIKDKLFFFVSYEDFESANSVSFAAQDANEGYTQEFFDVLNQTVLDVYGIDMQGRPGVVSDPIESERWTAKLDWVINDQHRAAVSYQRVREDDLSGISNESFQSAFYATPQELDAYNFEIFSDWSPNLSTQFRVNYREFLRGQNCLAGRNVGQLEFRFSEADLVGTPLEGLFDDGDDVVDTADDTTIGGCDRFRHANEFEDERLQLFSRADYTWGDHVTSFGVEYQTYDLFNLFVQSSLGRYIFDDFNELVTGTPNVSYFNVNSNIAADGAADWGYNILALYAQDEWQILPDLTINAGIRYERYLQDDEPDARQSFEDAFGFSNTTNLDGLDIVQPRIGFQYRPSFSPLLERTTITGGFGLFSGGNPQVWVSNAFQPVIFGGSVDFAETGGFADPNQIPQAALDEVGAGDPSNTPAFIDFISPDFEIPSDWKASIRIDQEFDLNFGGFNLGNDYLLSLQWLHTRANNGFLWRNIAQTELTDALPTGVAPDGRVIYADLQDLGINNAVALDNFDDGSSNVFTVQLAKAYDAGVSFDVAYAFQDIEATTEGNSSRGISSWRGIQDIDRNFPSPKTGNFEIRHSFKVGLGYEKDIFGDLETRFDIFGVIESGDPFLYSFDVSPNNSLFGRAGNFESPFDNSPLYIPAVSGGTFDDPLVEFASDFNQAGFIEYIEDRGIATGAIFADRSDRSPWNQQWDLRIQQELPGIPGVGRFVGDNRIKLVLDIENVMNLLNDEWGNRVGPVSNNDLNIVTADLISETSIATFIAENPGATRQDAVDNVAALTGDLPRTTCVAAADCIYRFNDFDADPSGVRDLNNSTYRIRLGIRYEF